MTRFLSQAGDVIRDTEWIIPLVQSVHIATVAALVGSVLVLELRVAGRLAVATPLAAVARRFLPVIWLALPILLATGVIMVVGEPYRTVGNWVFWTKMLLVLSMLGLTLWIRRPLLRPSGDSVAAPPTSFAFSGYLMLAGWLAVIVCGRFIAYAGND